MLNHLKKELGAAIIMALFIVSLVTIAAVTMMTRLQMDILRTELSFNDTKKMLYATGSLFWAEEQLISNWKHQQKNKPIDLTPITSSINKIDGVTIQSTIYDAEGWFNLNNLKTPQFAEGFAHLIQVASPKTDAKTAHDIVNAIVDWISEDLNNFSYDDFYIKQNPPYRAPHQLMVSVSELRLVKGVTKDLYQAILPFVTALPEKTKINVNNASPYVLLTLNPNMSLETVKTIIFAREKKPYANVLDFSHLDVVKNNSISEDQITVLSNYFLVKTNVKVDQQETILYTLLKRTIVNAQPVCEILWQSKGTL